MTRTEEAPLSGMRVLVTRSRSQASELSGALVTAGATPIEFPTIAIAPPEDGYASLDEAIELLHQFDWLVFTSSNAVEHFWRRLEALARNIRDVEGIRVAAIGRATRSALEERGIRVTLIPSRAVAESLLEELIEQGLDGKEILLPVSDIAREILAVGLREAGARVTVTNAYRTIAAEAGGDALTELNRGIDAITFTSSSTARNFIRALGSEHAQRLLDGVIVASIGPITSRTARDLGLRVDIESEEQTISGLVTALIAYRKKRQP